VKRLCNRCNAEKTSNAPCEKCGCQEFRIPQTESEPCQSKSKKIKA
jgi:hypothetical protein